MLKDLCNYLQIKFNRLQNTSFRSRAQLISDQLRSTQFFLVGKIFEREKISRCISKRSEHKQLGSTRLARRRDREILWCMEIIDQVKECNGGSGHGRRKQTKTRSIGKILNKMCVIFGYGLGKEGAMDRRRGRA